MDGFDRHFQLHLIAPQGAGAIRSGSQGLLKYGVQTEVGLCGWTKNNDATDFTDYID